MFWYIGLGSFALGVGSESVTCLGGFAGRVCLLSSGSSSISLYPIVRGLFRFTRSSDLLATFGGASVCASAYSGWSVQ